MEEESMPQQIPRDVCGALRLYVPSNQTPPNLRELRFYTTPPPPPELDLRFDPSDMLQELSGRMGIVFIRELTMNLPRTDVGGYVYGRVGDLNVAYVGEKTPTLNNTQEAYVREWLPRIMREIYGIGPLFPAIGRINSIDDIFVVGFLFGDNWSIQLQCELNRLMKDLALESLY